MRQIFIDPPSKAFYQNRFFEDSAFNRDECLRPYIVFKEKLHDQGIEVNTFDLWDGRSGPIEYYSFGMLDNLDRLSIDPLVKMKAFYVFEPSIVDPRIYKALPKITALFDEVYVHNIEGDGYDLHGVDQTKLRKLFWPQPFDTVLEKYWQKEDRQKKCVVINGNHKPASRHNELYSKRIEAMVALSQYDAVDLYGRGWDKSFFRSSLWLPYWKNRKKLLSIYKGACESKFDILSQYQFCLCFENMVMKGYMTEKLFDCLYAGTIPIYFGAPDIETFVPDNVYIDVRKFSSWHAMWVQVEALSEEQCLQFKVVGKNFLEGELMKKFSISLMNSFLN